MTNNKKKYLKLFPYQNTSLKNLPGEKWKDIVDFEGLYQISNYGRIKSLKREGFRVDGWRYSSAEKIRKTRLSVTTNKMLNQPIYSLNITLNKEGEKYSFSVSRLVYYTFIQKFDLEDLSIWITFKDQDGRNAHYANLIQSNHSKVSLRSYNEGRAKSHLSVLKKPITQFDSQGKVVNHYSSIYEAAKQLSLETSLISAAANGIIKTCKGYFWRFGYKKRGINISETIKSKLPEQLINKDLMKRLKIKNTNLRDLPVFLNLSPKTLKGEKWKDVPGYEGHYQISNLGRVKALERLIKTERQQRWYPEKIKYLTVDFRTGKKNQEKPSSMLVTLAKEQVKKSISIARLVYYLFVKRFNRENLNLRVYYKDGNSLNCSYKNLYLRNAAWSINKQ